MPTHREDRREEPQSVADLKREIYEQRGELMDELRSADQLQQDQIDLVTKVVDRLTVAVLGDESLGVKGLIKDMNEQKDESLKHQLQRAKWAGVGLAIGVIANGLFFIVEHVLIKK